MRSKRFALRAIAAVAVFGLVAAACGNDEGGPGQGGDGGGEKPTVKIAFFGALTGDYKLLVIHGAQAAELAFDQANQAGDLPVTIEFLKEDTQGSGDQASPLADRVIADNEVVGVIGPAFSGESAATGDKFDQAGIPFVTPSATDDALATHGWTHWFRAVGNNSDEAKPAAAYIQNTAKPNCTFVASDGTAYGHGLAAIVFNVLSDAGQNVKPEEQVAPAQKDYSALVTKIQGSGCKALFYGGYSPEAGLIRKQMNQAGLSDVVMVGGDGIKDETFTGTAGKAGDGTISICPCVSPADLAASAGNVAGIQKLITDYKGKFGEDPGIYAAEGWDVAQIFISAFKAGKTDRDSITSYIRGLQGFAGLAKSYSWQPDGELFPASRTMFVYEVKNGKYEFLGDAATVTAPAE